MTAPESNEATQSTSAQHQHDTDVHEAPTTEGQHSIVPRISGPDSMAIISIDEPATRGEGAAVQVVYLLVTVKKYAGSGHLQSGPGPPHPPHLKICVVQFSLEISCKRGLTPLKKQLKSSNSTEKVVS